MQSADAPSRTADTTSWHVLLNERQYCRLCQRFVTEQHLASSRHDRFYSAFNASPWELGEVAAPTFALPTAHPGESLPDAVKGAEHPPPEWGERRLFAWRTHGWWCTLCLKESDRWHVGSRQHRASVRRLRSDGLCEDAGPADVSAGLATPGSLGALLLPLPEDGPACASATQPGMLPWRSFADDVAALAPVLILTQAEQDVAAAARLRRLCGWGPAFALPAAALRATSPGDGSPAGLDNWA